MIDKLLEEVGRIDKRLLARNTMISSIFGGMLGLALTISVISVFTLVSTN